MHPKAIEEKILAAMPEAKVIVSSEDHVHYSARVIYKGFANQTRIQQHRMVYQALGEDMKEAIHALALKTEIPKEETQ